MHTYGKKKSKQLWPAESQYAVYLSTGALPAHFSPRKTRVKVIKIKG